MTIALQATHQAVHSNSSWNARIRARLRQAVAVAPLVALAFVSTPASAQVVQELLPPVEHPRVISVNPLLLIFSGIVSLDYEQRVTSNSTLGASISSFGYSDADYLSLEARGRYYVNGRALDGLSVGTVLGLVRMQAQDSTDVRQYAMNIGFTVEQQWLLGVDERVALTAGGGASRLFFSEDRDPFRRVLPILRLSLGWGF